MYISVIFSICNKTVWFSFYLVYVTMTMVTIYAYTWAQYQCRQCRQIWCNENKTPVSSSFIFLLLCPSSSPILSYILCTLKCWEGALDLRQLDCFAWLNIQINIFRRKYNMIKVFLAGTLWCSQYWMAASRTGTRSLGPHRTPSSWPQSADPRVQVGSSNHRMASLLKCQQSRCNSYSNKRRR